MLSICVLSITDGYDQYSGEAANAAGASTQATVTSAAGTSSNSQRLLLTVDTRALGAPIRRWSLKARQTISESADPETSA